MQPINLLLLENQRSHIRKRFAAILSQSIVGLDNETTYCLQVMTKVLKVIRNGIF